MKQQRKIKAEERKRIKIGLLAVCLAAFLSLTWLTARADDYSLQGSFPANRSKAQTVQIADGSMALSVKKGTSTDDLVYNLNKIVDQENVSLNYRVNEGLSAESDLFTLELSTATGTDVAMIIKDFDPRLIVKYPADNKSHQLYIWDKLGQTFVPVGADNDLKTRVLTYHIVDGGELIIGVFSPIENVGKASWYVHPRYKKDLMAASTAYPRGAQVKVTNLENDKSVIVTIKDWGPDPAKHPERIIDLGKVAFAQIASIRAGTIQVRVEPVASSTATSTAASTTAAVAATSTATSSLSVK